MIIIINKKDLYEKDFSRYYTSNPGDKFHFPDFVQTESNWEAEGKGWERTGIRRNNALYLIYFRYGFKYHKSARNVLCAFVSYLISTVHNLSSPLFIY